MTPSATSIPTQTTEARAEAFMWLLRRGVLTPKQMKDAMDFGWAAARNKVRDADVGGGGTSQEATPKTPGQSADALAVTPAADVSAAKQEEKS